MKGELVWCYLNPCVGSADDAGQSALELKVVPQGSDISEYDAYAGDDEDAQEEPGEPEAEPEDQPLAAAVRSLEEAMETEKERHSDSMRQLQAAIDNVQAAASPQQLHEDSSEPRLPFCDNSSKKFSWANSTFRAERICLSHPALHGSDRDLTPKGCLEDLGVVSG